MYTEGYISKVEVTKEGVCNFWIDPQSPFRVKYGEKTWLLAVGMKDFKIEEGDAILFSTDKSINLLRGAILDKPTLLMLKNSHCKVGIEFEDKQPYEVIRLVCL